MIAVFVNMLTVLLGSTIGLVCRNRIRENVVNCIFSALALITTVIGICSAVQGKDTLCLIICLVLGTAVGTLLDFDGRMDRAGAWVQQKVLRGKQVGGRFAEGFVSATLLFCVGAMTVVGSINSGISGDNLTLYSKGLIDCIAAIPLTASFGFGVMLASVSVLIIEGGISLLAVWVAPLLSGEIIAHMTAVGSLLIVALSLNMLGITKIKVMNYLPAIFLPILFLSLF